MFDSFICFGPSHDGDLHPSARIEESGAEKLAEGVWGQRPPRSEPVLSLHMSALGGFFLQRRTLRGGGPGQLRVCRLPEF